MPIEQISRLVGHSGTSVTELVSRTQIHPVGEDGAVTMDRLFPTGDQDRAAVELSSAATSVVSHLREAPSRIAIAARCTRVKWVKSRAVEPTTPTILCCLSPLA